MIPRQYKDQTGWKSHSGLSDDLTAQTLLTSPWVWCHHCWPLQTDEAVTVHCVAAGYLTQCCHVTVTAVWPGFVCTTYIRRRLASLAAAFIVIPLTTSLRQQGSKWCLLTARSHGRQSPVPRTADVTLPLLPKLHSYFYAGLTCYHRHCTTVITFLCYCCSCTDFGIRTDSFTASFYTLSHDLVLNTMIFFESPTGCKYQGTLFIKRLLYVYCILEYKATFFEEKA